MDDGRHRIRTEKKETITKKTREITEDKSLARTIEALRKQNAELQDRLAKATNSDLANVATKPDAKGDEWQNTPRRKPAECWGCGDRKHRLWACPNIMKEDKERIARNNQDASSKVRPVQEKRTGTCIMVRYKKRKIRALIDTGSDITLAGEMSLEGSFMRTK